MPTGLTYDYLTHHIVPGPQSLSYFIPLLLLPLALLVPRSVLSRWQSIGLFMPVVAAATVHACLAIGGVDVVSIDTLLWCLVLLALKDPWEDFRRIRNPNFDDEKRPQDSSATEQIDLNCELKLAAPGPSGGRSHDEQPYPHNLRQRLPWVGTLLVSIRLNNWRIRTPSHDKHQPQPPAFPTRKAFVLHGLLCFARGYLILDLTRAYVAHDPYFHSTTIPITSPLPFSAPYIPPHIVRTAVIGLQAWALILHQVYLPCLVPVALHAMGLIADEWSPHFWPPYFGHPDVVLMYGVRGFWGKYWHQTMRFTSSQPGYALADLLHLQPGGMARYAIITAITFGLTGVVHMGLVPPEPLHSTIPANEIRLLVAGFFWVQPVAMLGEMLVARAAVRANGLEYWQDGIGRRLRLVGNGMWAVAWFSCSIMLLGEAGRQLGYWRHWIVPVSLWRGLRGQGWVAWPFLLGNP